MIKIAIIGGGFYGCYLAYKLKDKFKTKAKIDLFEKNKSFYTETFKDFKYAELTPLSLKFYGTINLF